MTRLSPKVYDEIKRKLFRSDEFKGSKNSKTLLEYLIECSLNATSPKETTIAAEVFGRDKEFHPGEDPLVRVHIHNLRKKLENYYDNEGKQDKYKLEIPKGHYSLEIIKTEKKIPEKHMERFNVFLDGKRISLLVIFALVITIVVLLIVNTKLSRQLNHFQIIPSNNPIWSNFLENEKETVIVCGDHFFYNIEVPFAKRSIHIRDTWVNSVKDMSEIYFLPDSARPSDQSYFPRSVVWTLPNLTRILTVAPRAPIIRASSELTSTLIEEQNLIYVGNVRSLGLLKHYLKQAGLTFDNRKRVLYYKERDETAIFETEADESLFHKDYAIVLKLNGPRQNTIMIIASFFTSGVKETTRYLTHPNLLKIVENELVQSKGFVPDSFLLIIEVSGIQQAGVKADIVMAKEIDAVVTDRLEFLDSLEGQ